jgi:hypothetical protein
VAEIAEELHQATLPAGGYADAAGQKVDQQFDEVGWCAAWRRLATLGGVARRRRSPSGRRP